MDAQFNMSQVVLAMRTNQQALFEYYELNGRALAKQYQEFLKNGFTPEQAMHLIRQN